MSASAASSRCAAIFLPLAMTLSSALTIAVPADGERARPVGAHAERHAARVAVDDVHVVERNAELGRDDLRERGLVALPVAVRAGEDRHAARRMHAHFARFEKARARAQRAGDVRRREPAGFDVGRVADAAQLAALRGFRLACREAGDIRHLVRFVERRVVVAGVVAERDRRLVRKRADEVAAADFVLRDAEIHADLVDEPLDHVRGLGPSGAAVGVHRGGVGERRGHLRVDRGRRVLPREQRRVQDRRDARGERRQVRAHRGRRVHAHREELAVLVAGHLGVRDVVAAVRIREKAFAALGRPLDRAIDALRRPDHRRLFGVEVDLRAEAAADVRRDHPHLVLRQAEHERGHEQALDMRILVGDIERIAVVGAAVRSNRRARLDRVGDQPVVDDVELRDVRGLGEGGVHRRLVAQRPRVALVAGCPVVDLRRTGLQRVDAIDHCGKLVVIDDDELGGILRLVRRLGDDEGDRIAHVADLALREHRVRRLVHRLAVGARDEPAAGQSVDAGEIVGSEDGHDPGGRLRLARVDLADLRVRVRRAQEIRVDMVWRADVVGVLSRARQEPVVLLAQRRTADDALIACWHHASCVPMAAAPCCTAFTTL